MKNILKNLTKSILIILIWNVIDLILGNGISIKSSIIGFIVFFIISTIVDCFNKKTNKKLEL